MNKPSRTYTPGPSPARDLAMSALFGAAALLLPSLFHLVHLGHVFMPMYLPLMVLAFLVRPAWAAGTALSVPLLSAVATGMPPLYPPIGVMMALELALMAFLASWATRRFPALRTLVVLIPTLLLGRLFYVALALGMAKLLSLPARFVAGISLLAGWPGVLLMVAVVPATLALIRRPTRRTSGVPHEPDVA